MTGDNEKTYVTFKWMLMQTLVIVFSIVGIAVTIIASINTKIESGLMTKVSIIQFDERTKSLTQKDTDICDLLAQYSRNQTVTNDKLSTIEQHLAIMLGKPLSKFKEIR